MPPLCCVTRESDEWTLQTKKKEDRTYVANYLGDVGGGWSLSHPSTNV